MACWRCRAPHPPGVSDCYRSADVRRDLDRPLVTVEQKLRYYGDEIFARGFEVAVDGRRVHRYESYDTASFIAGRLTKHLTGEDERQTTLSEFRRRE